MNRFARNRRKLEAVTVLGKGIVASIAIRSFVAFADSYILGMGVTEYGPEHKSAWDIEMLASDMRGVRRDVGKLQLNGSEMSEGQA